MRAKTHMLVGAVAVAPLAAMTGAGGAVFVFAGGVLGSLLPDADIPTSPAGRLLPWPSRTRPNGRFIDRGRMWRNGHTVWHRCETHSFAAGILGGALLGFIVGGLALALAGHGIGGAIPISLLELTSVGGVIGYWSHLVIDTVNVTPQMLLWPISRVRMRPNPLPAIAEDSILGRLAEAVVSVVAGLLLLQMLGWL